MVEVVGGVQGIDQHEFIDAKNERGVCHGKGHKGQEGGLFIGDDGKAFDVVLFEAFCDESLQCAPLDLCSAVIV